MTKKPNTPVTRYEKRLAAREKAKQVKIKQLIAKGASPEFAAAQIERETNWGMNKFFTGIGDVLSMTQSEWDESVSNTPDVPPATSTTPPSTVPSAPGFQPSSDPDLTTTLDEVNIIDELPATTAATPVKTTSTAPVVPPVAAPAAPVAPAASAAPNDPMYEYLGINVPGYESQASATSAESVVAPPVSAPMQKYNKAMEQEFNIEEESSIPDFVAKPASPDISISPTNEELAPEKVSNREWNKTFGDAASEGMDWGGLTTGDKIGMIAGGTQQLIQTGITLYDRLSDTPNKSHFANYGERALKKVGEARSFARKTLEDQLSDITLNEATANRGLRTMSRGVGALRAGALSTHMQTGQMKRQARGDYYGRMGEIIGQEAQLMEQQDKIRMDADERADIANRKDKGAFYSALSSDAADMGKYFQNTGKNMNQAQQNKEMQGLISEMSKYGYHYDRKTGKMTYNS